VLDSFAGGGTTGVAAYKKSRHCISIEKEEAFILSIKARQLRAERKMRAS
jgi:DNA modification methylase